MATESQIIDLVYSTLRDEGLWDIADVIDACCIWGNKNSLIKVKYWLKYGMEHGGSYRSTNIARSIEKVNPEHLKHAFLLLEEEIECYM